MCPAHYGRVFYWPEGGPRCRNAATAPRHASFNPESCARNSTRHRKRCFSRRAMSTTIRRRPRRASRAKFRASNIRASPIRPCACSRPAWRISKAPRTARATATGMAAVTLALMGQVKAGDHIVSSRALVRIVSLCGRGIAAALRRHLDAGRRHRSFAMEECGAAQHQDLLHGDAGQSDAGGDRYRGRREDRARRRRDRHRRQRVLDPALAEPAQARRRLRGLFDHQAYRRPGPLPRRHRAGLQQVHPGQHPQSAPPDRPVDVAVQCLGDAEGAGDARHPRAPADQSRRAISPTRSPAIRSCHG